MTRALSHRGPDADGFYSDAAAGVHFGHRRLSILDHEGGAQPMHSWCGNFVIVFNGEIYNFRELREELAGLGATFRTDHSDTEVLLEGWRYWGTSLPGRLNGMWAFVIHDRSKGLLFASRDRFGKKPFFWCHTSDAFIFSSELTSIRLHTGTPGSLDDMAIQKYFAYGYVPAPRTFLRGVYKLPAGHSLELDLASNKLNVKRYWKYTPLLDTSLSEHDAEEQLYQLLGRAVSRRMVAD
ncbi:MAG TPA: asparagine synthetase B, partial [Porticoccaceae bacterium]